MHIPCVTRPLRHKALSEPDICVTAIQHTVEPPPSVMCLAANRPLAAVNSEAL